MCSTHPGCGRSPDPGVFIGGVGAVPCARTMVLSIIAYSLSVSAAKCCNRRSHTPAFSQRLNWQSTRRIAPAGRAREFRRDSDRAPLRRIDDYLARRADTADPQAISGHGSTFCKIRPDMVHTNSRRSPNVLNQNFMYLLDDGSASGVGKAYTGNGEMPSVHQASAHRRGARWPSARTRSREG